MIAIIDYGMGNLHSVQKAIEEVGAVATITHEEAQIISADKVVLPGVGAMLPAMKQIESLGIAPAIKKFIKQKRPFLGICLGFQLLFEIGFEGGRVTGLGILPGHVIKFSTKPMNNTATEQSPLKIPHMGWNQIQITRGDCPLFRDIQSPSYVYFCHSYYAQPFHSTAVAATSFYGNDFCASLWQDNIFGVQFHPEKSQAVGLQILKNFVEI